MALCFKKHVFKVVCKEQETADEKWDLFGVLFGWDAFTLRKFLVWDSDNLLYTVWRKQRVF